MTFGGNFQEAVSTAISETPANVTAQLMEIGRRRGDSYGKFMGDLTKLPKNYQLILLASFCEGTLSAMHEVCPEETDVFSDFVSSIFFTPLDENETE